MVKKEETWGLQGNREKLKHAKPLFSPSDMLERLSDVSQIYLNIYDNPDKLR